jgi:hypothetical protein
MPWWPFLIIACVLSAISCPLVIHKAWCLGRLKLSRGGALVACFLGLLFGPLGLIAALGVWGFSVLEIRAEQPRKPKGKFRLWLGEPFLSCKKRK